MTILEIEEKAYKNEPLSGGVTSKVILENRMLLKGALGNEKH